MSELLEMSIEELNDLRLELGMALEEVSETLKMKQRGVNL